MTQDQTTVEGMDRRQHPPAVAEAINALYESDHPKFESRMERKLLSRLLCFSLDDAGVCDVSSV